MELQFHRTTNCIPDLLVFRFPEDDYLQNNPGRVDYIHGAQVARDLGFEGLRFLKGEIKDFAPEGSVDMVVTLHACDTATDDALGQALKWRAKVILLVPLALVLPWVTNSVMGIYVAEPIADFLASATTLTLFLSRRKKLLPLEKDRREGKK